MSFWVYMLASQRNGTIYIGHTDDLGRRVAEHKAKTFGGFTAKHNVHKLVWWEEHPTRDSAFVRERRMKDWDRELKKTYIERFNPGWRDLYEVFTGCTMNAEAEAARFLAALDAENEKNLDPGRRRGERDSGGAECPNS